MERLIEFLKKYEEISDYRITRINRLSNQLYFVLGKLETTRVVDTTNTSVVICNRHNDKIGSANFSYSDTMTDEELTEQIERTIKQAKLINNENFTLPTGEVYVHELDSNFRAIPLNTLAADLSETIFSCIDEDELSINSLEIFISKTTRQIVNSLGLDKTEVKYTGFYEAIPTYTKENPDDVSLSSVELFDEFSFGDYNKEQIINDVKQKLAEVKARYYAKPMKIEDVPVVLQASELAEIFHNIARETNYEPIYNHQNILEIGDNLQDGGNADKLTIILRGIIPSSASSELFDNNGIEYIDTMIVENGVIVNGYGTGSFAQYLNKVPTGNLPCIDVVNGNLTDEEIKENKYLSCLSFSGIQIDIANDYIGGEVRLAMYFDGEKEIPVTGLSISGSLSNFLKTVKLSKDTTTCQAYRGPKNALSKAFKII